MKSTTGDGEASSVQHTQGTRTPSQWVGHDRVGVGVDVVLSRPACVENAVS